MPRKGVKLVFQNSSSPSPSPSSTCVSQKGPGIEAVIVLKEACVINISHSTVYIIGMALVWPAL